MGRGEGKIKELKKRTTRVVGWPELRRLWVVAVQCALLRGTKQLVDDIYLYIGVRNFDGLYKLMHFFEGKVSQEDA